MADSRDCVSLLIKLGAKVDAMDGTSGRTALHYCTTVEKENIVLASSLLLEVRTPVFCLYFSVQLFSYKLILMYAL